MRPGDHQDLPMPFGVHKDKLIADVPSSYLRWILEQDWFVSKFTDLKKQAEIELEFRDRFDKHF